MLRVHSIFMSISGESGLITQGSNAIFIRLQGCNLRCSYCDTVETQAREGGKEYTPSEILAMVQYYQRLTRHIIITGGEPLLQRSALVELVDKLSNHGFVLQIETNGTIPVFREYSKEALVHWVVDSKNPGTRTQIALENQVRELEQVSADIKFIFRDTQDVDRMLEECVLYIEAGFTGGFLFSPCFDEEQNILVTPATFEYLTDMLLLYGNNHPILFEKSAINLQIHKICKLP